jgi:hypothetical protein
VGRWGRSETGGQGEGKNDVFFDEVHEFEFAGVQVSGREEEVPSEQ